MSGKDEARLRAWVKKLGSWQESGLDRCFFYIHQANNALIPDALDYMNWKLFESSLVESKALNLIKADVHS